MILAKEKLDDNWIYGHLLNDHSKKGITPLTHLTKVYLETNSIEESSNKVEVQQARVLYSFDNDTTYSGYNCLKLNVGDYILIKGSLDQNWLIGENINGDNGILPFNYIEYIEGKRKFD